MLVSNIKTGFSESAFPILSLMYVHVRCKDIFIGRLFVNF